MCSCFSVLAPAKNRSTASARRVSPRLAPLSRSLKVLMSSLVAARGAWSSMRWRIHIATNATSNTDQPPCSTPDAVAYRASVCRREESGWKYPGSLPWPPALVAKPIRTRHCRKGAMRLDSGIPHSRRYDTAAPAGGYTRRYDAEAPGKRPRVPSAGGSSPGHDLGARRRLRLRCASPRSTADSPSSSGSDTTSTSTPSLVTVSAWRSWGDRARPACVDDDIGLVSALVGVVVAPAGDEIESSAAEGAVDSLAGEFGVEVALHRRDPEDDGCPVGPPDADLLTGVQGAEVREYGRPGAAVDVAQDDR